MYNDPDPPEDPNEYKGHKFVGAGNETHNYTVKQILTDTSGAWRQVGRIGSISFWENNTQGN